MNASLSHLKFLRPAAALGLAALLLAGCWEDRVVWSPDGTRAAIITKAGLHLSGAAGQLSPVLAPGAYRAAWLAGSQQLVIARSRKISDYAALAAALGPERTRALTAKAEALWQRLAASPKIEINSSLEPEDELGAIFLYLRAHHNEALRAKLEPKERADFDAAAAEWHSLAVARIVGDRLAFDPPIAEGLAGIRDIRPTPLGSALAFVMPIELNPDNDGGLGLFVAPLDHSAPPSLLATQTAAHPDWTPDSRTLVYLQADGSHSSGAPDDLRLGALVERDVLDAAGHVHLSGKLRELAGLIFQEENRVRCLHDGRVLFDAAEFRLPLAGGDRHAREQLFAFDRTKNSPALTPLIPPTELGRLPNSLALFHVSPDETAVLFGGGGDVPVLHLDDGRIEHIALALVDSENGRNPPLPAWRSAGEFTYLKKASPRNELVLRRGGAETVLSRSWPDEVLQQLIE